MYTHIISSSSIDIIEGEIRSAQHEVLLETASLVLNGDPIARQLREPGRADDQTERNPGMKRTTRRRCAHHVRADRSSTSRPHPEVVFPYVQHGWSARIKR